jgi:hypothetical protein
MRTFAALAVLAVATAPAAAEVAVRVSGGQVDLTATAAPLAEVLDRLARQTGMKVVYEGAVPRQLVTISLHGRTPIETVLSVFEGLGVNFALVADPGGSRIQTLVIAGTAVASAPSGGASRPAQSAPMHRPFGPPPGASPDTADPAFQEADEEAAGDEETFSGLPPGAEANDPAGALINPPDPGQPNSPPLVPPVPQQGTVVPAQPTPSFPSSPFMPQPMPFPQPGPTVPQAPVGPVQDEPTPPNTPAAPPQ